MPTDKEKIIDLEKEVIVLKTNEYNMAQDVSEIKLQVSQIYKFIFE
jgi:hypothetical protein